MLLDPPPRPLKSPHLNDALRPPTRSASVYPSSRGGRQTASTSWSHIAPMFMIDGWIDAAAWRVAAAGGGGGWPVVAAATIGRLPMPLGSAAARVWMPSELKQSPRNSYALTCVAGALPTPVAQL